MSSHPTSHVSRLELNNGSLLRKAGETTAWDGDAWGGKFNVVQADFTDNRVRLHSEGLGGVCLAIGQQKATHPSAKGK